MVRLDTATVVFVALFVVMVGLAFTATRWRRPTTGLDRLDEWGVGGRAFGNWVTWFLIGGAAYSAYTFVALPAYAWGNGAMAFYAVPYALLATPLVYFVSTRYWSVAHAHGFVTMAEFARARWVAAAGAGGRAGQHRGHAALPRGSARRARGGVPGRRGGGGVGPARRPGRHLDPHVPRRPAGARTAVDRQGRPAGVAGDLGRAGGGHVRRVGAGLRRRRPALPPRRQPRLRHPAGRGPPVDVPHPGRRLDSVAVRLPPHGHGDPRREGPRHDQAQRRRAADLLPGAGPHGAAGLLRGGPQRLPHRRGSGRRELRLRLQHHHTNDLP